MADANCLCASAKTRSVPRTLVALSLVLLGLAACDRRITDPARPATQASNPSRSSQPVVPSVADPSVPPAASVVSPSSAPTAQDAATGRVTGTLSKTQETSAMPMPGQVNNHSSTALDPAKRGASAP